MIGERGITLIYGGSRVGLMGVIADAVLAVGGRVVGVIPKHLRTQESDHNGLTERLVVDSIHSRKQLMFERADGFIALPGGFGTIDETIEVISWKQLGLHNKPIVLVDENGYWSPLLALFDHIIEAGFAGSQDRELFAVATAVDKVFDVLACSHEQQ
jgi:uncharacterized protein (TIGR00730 family)